MTRQTPDDEHGTSRRAVLRSAAAGAVAGLAATGGAAARRRTEPGGYADPIAAEAALAEHAGDVLADLSADGVLADGAVAELPTRRPTDLGAVAANGEGTATVFRDGERRFVSTTHVGGGVLTVTVEPATGTSYAVVETDAGDRRLYVPDADADGVETSSCFTTCDCLRLKCNDGSLIEECEECCATSCVTHHGCCD